MASKKTSPKKKTSKKAASKAKAKPAAKKKASPARKARPSRSRKPASSPATEPSFDTNTPRTLPDSPEVRTLPTGPKKVDSTGRVSLTCRDCSRGFKVEAKKGRYPSRCPECHKAAYGNGNKLRKAYKQQNQQ